MSDIRQISSIPPECIQPNECGETCEVINTQIFRSTMNRTHFLSRFPKKSIFYNYNDIKSISYHLEITGNYEIGFIQRNDPYCAKPIPKSEIIIMDYGVSIHDDCNISLSPQINGKFIKSEDVYVQGEFSILRDMIKKRTDGDDDYYFSPTIIHKLTNWFTNINYYSPIRISGLFSAQPVMRISHLSKPGYTDYKCGNAEYFRQGFDAIYGEYVLNNPDKRILPRPYGLGTEENPWRIYSIESFWENGIQYKGLHDINNLLSDYYVLMNDLDFQGLSYNESILANGAIYPQDAFAGTFDGQGYAIYNVYINGLEGNALGLFGYNIGTIKNLSLDGFNVLNGTNLAGLCALNYGNIFNCYVSGTVTGVLVGGNSYYGGLCARNFAGVISECFSDCTINGARFVGGIVGQNRGVVERSYSIGDVVGVDFVGGAIGYQYSSGTALDCATSAFVDGSGSGAGGFCGLVSVGGNIQRCCSSGIVDGNNDVGGFCGDNSGTISDSFWDIESSGQMVSSGGIGKTTAEMKTESTFTDAGWDFSSTWEMSEITSDFNGYPVLKWQNA